MTSPLLSLVDRLEAATGPDRELFEDVFRECFPKPDNVWAGPVSRVEWTAEYSEWHARQCAFYDFLEAGAFLDAAMSLLDDKWFFHVSRFTDGSKPGSAHVYPNRGLGDDYEADAATPALALCAAALRAKAAQ